MPNQSAPPAARRTARLRATPAPQSSSRRTPAAGISTRWPAHARPGESAIVPVPSVVRRTGSASAEDDLAHLVRAVGAQVEQVDAGGDHGAAVGRTVPGEAG